MRITLKALALGLTVCTSCFASAALPMAETDVVATSVEGRAIESETHGEGDLRVYLIGSIHGDEPEGLAVLDEAVEAFNASDVASSATLRVVRDMNPDGTARGARHNARRVDLNRNWPANTHAKTVRNGRKPLSEPETRAVHSDMIAFDPHLVIVLHSARSGPFVDPDGDAKDAAEAFVRGAQEADARWRVRESFTNPDGSLGSYLGYERGAPVLTVEFLRGDDSPENADVLAFGLIEAVRSRTASEPRPTISEMIAD